MAATYCSPEADHGNYERLKGLARHDDDQQMRVFKTELGQALADPHQLPGDELFKAVDYGDGSDERFLRRLWRDLYGDEPVTGDASPADTELLSPSCRSSPGDKLAALKRSSSPFFHRSGSFRFHQSGV